MTRFVVAALLTLMGTSLLADDVSRTWEGTWVNRRYNTNGTLRCVAKPDKDGTWRATFSGKFMSESFSYDVTFNFKPGKNQSELSGTAEIRNHKYEWTGTMKGDVLTGKYRSNSGYFGEFELKEMKK